MEVKPGYKQTEVGVVPEEWKLTRFVSLGSVIDGDRGANYPSGRDFSSDGHCLFLNAGNVTKAGFRFSDCAFISREKDERLCKGKLQRDDIVGLTTRGTVGNFAHFDSTVCFEHIRINSGMVILRNESAELDNAFLYALLQSHFLETQIERLTFGSAQPQLTVKGINEFWIVAPPLPEQRAIAEALSDVDGLLGGLDRLIAKKRDLKQAAMQQLLTGQTRLPGFHGEWEVKRLGEVAEIVMGQSPSSSNYNTTGMGLPLIQGNADIDNRKTIKRIFTTQITKRGRNGDILMSVRAPVGEVSRAVFDVCLGRGVCAIRYDNDFMYHCLIYLEPTWAKHSKGSTFDSVNSADVKALEIRLPTDHAEQTAIAAVLSEMDGELAVLEQRREKTRALKQAMMQELLTGRTRLV